MRSFPDDLTALLGILRNCRDEDVPFDDERQQLIFKALARLEASAKELDAMLDAQTVMQVVSDDDPYSLYQMLNRIVDDLLPVEDGTKSLDVRQLRNNLIGAVAISANLGRFIQKMNGIVSEQLDAATASDENVISLSEWRT